MPTWNEVLGEVSRLTQVGPIDQVRRSYLAQLSKYTKRNTIAYYSGWLSLQQPLPVLHISDEDKNAFMATIHNLDRSKGLDLILHTPGGNLASAESLVDYLRRMFGADIRAIIPQLAMSAGTMMACAASRIVMGKHSNLGPIDPQINGIPASGVLEEFARAIEEVKKDPAAIPVWNAIIGKYHPSFLGECKNAVDWSEKIVCDWLATGMFLRRRRARDLATRAVKALSDRSATLNHARHLDIDYCIKAGLVIERLEEDDTLQDLVLTVHHAFMHTFGMSPALKIVENNMGVAMVRLRGAPGQA